MSATNAPSRRLFASFESVLIFLGNCRASLQNLTMLLPVLLVLAGSLLQTQTAQAEPWAQDSTQDNNTFFTPQTVTSDFQGMISHWYTPWPTLPFNTMRLWDTGTTWSDMNPAPGTYFWRAIDGWLKTTEQNGVTVVLTLGMTPLWASSQPGNLICHYGPGQCAPPDDVNPDGSGTDQHWKDFVTAIAQHVGTQVNYWEIWNEPDNDFFWLGTPAQMVRMARDARGIIQSINPNAQLLNAGTSSLNQYGLNWWDGYAAAGGLQWADIIAVHGDVRPYPPQCGVYPEAETFLVVMSNLHQVLAQYGQNDKPIWDTEASWGRTDLDCFTNQDLQAAFLARFYLMHLSTHVQRFYWRAWVDGDGGLDNPEVGLDKAGVAYGSLHNWLSGNTLVSGCTASGTVWTCDFTGPSNYVAAAIWDTSETCNNGRCSTHRYTVGSSYVDYRMLNGNTHQITDGTVPIGAKPIWVEN